MNKKSFYKQILIILIIFLNVIYIKAQEDVTSSKIILSSDIKTGSEQTERYLPWIKGKNIAIVANQSTTIHNTNLVDSLLSLGINIKKVFCPEHGFRGEAEAGETIKNKIDSKTGLNIISLYGDNKKPKAEDLKGIDIVIFDIQDVGARFFTYISTMHYVMEACAENNVEFIVLDRPNPNGYYIDGPVLEPKFTSFVGMHPVPIVHGMTIAEYATMINDEGWLKNGIKCKLRYVTVYNYNHAYLYILPIKPSPNLMNMNAIYLYPTLCLFEGSVISVGRGTNTPFQIVGNPQLDNTDFEFTPHSILGMAKDPLYNNKVCHGYNLSEYAVNILRNEKKLNLFWIIDFYKRLKDKGTFFTPFFDKLSGTDKLRNQIIEGIKEDDIRKSWQPAISKFKLIRKKYLLYPDFE
ncbi:MAG: DUF1343 domain-containing protein [Bacteroidota bacterium]